MRKLLLMLLLAASVARAETYKWVDAEGTIHFSESRGEVPAAYLKSAMPLGLDTTKTTYRDMSISSAESLPSGAAVPGAGELKERMMKDEATMALISSLQNDPDMQALLSDPSIVQAVQAGDIGALLKNPAFMRLLNNPRIREIENKVQQGGIR